MTDKRVAALRPGQAGEVPDAHVRAVLAAYDVTEGVAVVGIRGFYKGFDLAKTGGNLRGVYDDALVLVTPHEVRTFLGNTDPSSLVPGRAVLEAGHRYRYMRGTHNITKAKDRQYPAWVQAGPVRIRRQQDDGAFGPVLEGQWIGCNIHKGGWTTTASAACQTIAPEQWAAFDQKLEKALRAAAQDKFWYILTL